MLFPTPLEDETLYSLIARLMIINGRSPQTMSYKTHRHEPDRAADLIVDPDWLSTLTNDIYGPWPEIISQYHHSPQNLQEEISRIELIEFSNSNRNIWRWCEECTNTHLEKIGISYWQKHFQRECVLACTTHRSALQEINLLFRERQSKFLLPADTRSMPNKLACQDGQIGMAIEISEIDKSLSIERFIGDPGVLRNLFESNRKNSTYKSLMEKNLDIFSNGNQRTHTFISSLLNASEPPLRYLSVLIYATCGSYEFFKHQYEWIINFPLNELCAEQIQNKINHREICIRFINQSPNATKTDIWSSYPKTAKWLNKHDKAWFNQRVPNTNKQTVIQRQLF